MIRALKNLTRKIVFRYIKPEIKVRYRLNTYSQAGEDAVLTFLFADKKKLSLTYLDIGTNEPDTCNNTYLFYTRGNRGVCVEADKTLIPKIKNIRPEDKVIHAGVSVSEMKEADFYIFDIKGISTFDKGEAERRIAGGTYKITRVDRVPLMTINQLIKENFDTYPDLLSIDIEGLDLDVLKSLDFEKYPIPVICAETCAYGENHIRPKDKSIESFLVAEGYEIYADTYINTIFVNKNWFYTL
ncbi:MAG TPA: FkbM family methyltransferase [Bacteroidales bacterium]|mgnify:CR=1 FL=1|nr:FkbM family methyltransferase [Bacteroidales bacterium]